MHADAQQLAELRGTVRDPSEAVIVGAVVTLDGGSGRALVTRTDGQGQYRFTGLQPARYTLTTTSDGFAVLVAPVEVSPGLQRFDLTLEVQFRETVEVRASGAAPAVDGTTTVLTREDLAALPGDPETLLRRLQEMLGADSPGDVSVFVDGLSQTGRLPPRRSIQSIRLRASGFAAELADPGRGRIEIVTAPGAAGLNGELSLDFNHSALNARNPLAPTRANVLSRTLSGYLGGPIVRERWGFSLGVDQWRRDTESVVNATVLGPDTLEPRPFTASLRVPRSTRNANLRTDYQSRNGQRLMVSFGYDEGESSNQGLDGGLDLPERAFSSSDINRDLSVAVASTGAKSWVNELRVRINQSRDVSRAATRQLAIVVLDAFSGGGNQDSLFSEAATDDAQLIDHVTVTRGRHTYKAGVDLVGDRHRAVDASDSGGTFLFGADIERDADGAIFYNSDKQPIPIPPIERYRRTLLGLPGYGPSQFSVVRGLSTVRFNRGRASWFAQDDWAVSARATLSYGIRHDLQSQVAGVGLLAPRLAVAWVPDQAKRHTVRAGIGIFYQRVPADVPFNTLMYDGRRRERVIVDQPQFFGGEPAAVTGSPDRQMIYVASDDLAAPRTVNSSVTYERQLKATGVTATYTWARGERVLRNRNINAPVGGPSGPRPFPEQGPILQYESTGMSSLHELAATFRANPTTRLRLNVRYTLSSRRSDTEGPRSTPADSYDLASEFGPSDNDRRHRATLSASVTLPWKVAVDTFANLSSGRPFNVTTGSDNNGDSFFNDRPAFASSGEPDAIVTALGTFDPTPDPGDRIIPRNLGREGRQVRVDMRVSRAIPTGAEASMVPTIAIDNVFNIPYAAGFNGVLTSPYFATARRSTGPRRVTLSMAWSF